MSLENVLIARFSIKGLFVEIFREILQFLKFYTCEQRCQVFGQLTCHFRDENMPQICHFFPLRNTPPPLNFYPILMHICSFQTISGHRSFVKKKLPKIFQSKAFHSKKVLDFSNFRINFLEKNILKKLQWTSSLGHTTQVNYLSELGSVLKKWNKQKSAKSCPLFSLKIVRSTKFCEKAT